MENSKMSEEQWKPVSGFETLYEISNKGRIKSFHTCTRFSEEHYLDTTEQEDGYAHVCLVKESNGKKSFRKNMLVHRLVAETFIRPLQKGEVVHHLDNYKIHNDVENLEITTRAVNTCHAMSGGLNNGPTSSKGKNKRFSEDEVKEIRRLHSEEGFTYMKLAVKFDRNLSSIYHIIKGNSYRGLTVGRIKKEVVRGIRKMHKDGFSEKDILERYLVSKASFDGIINNITYKGL